MARTPWVIDGHGIAMKVKNARGLKNWRSDASISCPNCNHTITNAHVAQEWPGLPAGVKFDPSDQELLEHLAAKCGIGNARPHVLIDEFISTLEDYNGICYTHPENLPGVKQDGGSIHLFHKTTKAYTTGERKRRKITSDIHSGGEVRWHKTGKTRPVIENGIQKGCKKIMVLYMTSAKGSKAEKTNWVMHQYHLGTEEDEREGEFVVSKVFYQQQSKQCEKNDPDVIQEDAGTSSCKGDPVTPKTNTPLPPRSGKPHSCLDGIKEEELPPALSPQAVYLDATIHLHSKENDAECDSQKDFWNAALDDSMWPAAGESQFLEDSQELINHSLFCREMLENHSCGQSIEEENSIPCLAECGRIGGNELEAENSMPGLSQSGHTGSNGLVVGNSIPGITKSDSIEGNEPKSSKERVEAQNVMSGHGAIGRNEPERELNKLVDPTLANIELDTPPDGLITFSQFSSSQDTESLLGWINKELGLGESQSQGSK